MRGACQLDWQVGQPTSFTVGEGITYFGMSGGWWIFWLCAVILFFVVLRPVTRRRYRKLRDLERTKSA